MDEKVRNQEFYTSPVVKVVEVKARQVVCGSRGVSPATMEWSEDDGSNWQ